ERSVRSRSQRLPFQIKPSAPSLLISSEIELFLKSHMDVAEQVCRTNEEITCTRIVKRMVPPARFQRATFRLGGGRSMQLSYGSTPRSKLTERLFECPGMITFRV